MTPWLLQSRQRPVTVLMTSWVFAIVVGLLALSAHENTRGEPGSITEAWIDNALISRPTDRPTLLCFAHPRCPCLHASLVELERLLDTCSVPMQTYVVLYEPANADMAWSASIKRLAIPQRSGLFTIIDIDGKVAERFGVRTSADCLLFRADGRLVYRGGITGSRGHIGENVARRTLSELIKNPRTAAPAVMPVFGCPIFDTRPSTAGL